MTNLQKKQKGLQNEINKKRREANQLNARIDKLIAEEIERARKRAQEEARREAAARRKKKARRENLLQRKRPLNRNLLRLIP